MVQLRLSCNLHDLTLEQVIGKMQASPISMVQSLAYQIAQKLPGYARILESEVLGNEKSLAKLETSIREKKVCEVVDQSGIVGALVCGFGMKK